MTARRKMVLVMLGSVLALAVAIKGTQAGLRRIPFFKVRQVELVGVRYLAPDALIDAMQLGLDQNLFDDYSDVETRLSAVGGVVGVDLVRRLPGTLRVVVTERIPVAFAPGPAGLIALDETARPLPYDAATGGLDLPIVASADTTLVRVVATVQLADPNLYDQTEWVEFQTDGAVRLITDHHVIFLTSTPTVEEVNAVQAVRQHVATTGETFNEFDARFAGWVVVRRSRA